MTALQIIGDIGGTYARFAVAERGKYSELQHLSVSKYATLKDALSEYLDALPRDMRPTRGALAIAGPVSGDEVKLTNLNWSFSIAALKADLNMCSLVVVNDFAATAMSVPYLPEVDCYPIGHLNRRRAARSASSDPVQVSGLARWCRRPADGSCCLAKGAIRRCRRLRKRKVSSLKYFEFIGGMSQRSACSRARAW
jgi:glucokinase